MKQFKIYILVLFCVAAVALKAQSKNSYQQMETRFNKKTLTTQDSLAFKEAGILKAQTLFEYGDVYIQNTSNTANQAYVVNRVPELFYVAKGDTLNTDSVVLGINQIIENEKPNTVEIVFTEKKGVLGHVSTATDKLKFEADIILVKESKQFGKRREKVWQVFLSNPIFK